MKKQYIITMILGAALAMPFSAHAMLAPSQCTNQYTPVCGQKPGPVGLTKLNYNNMCLMQEDGANFVNYGTCDGSTTYPYNPTYPTYPTPTYPTYPSYPYYPTPTPYYPTNISINSFYGPTTLTTNQSGTWSVSVSNTGNQVWYDIRWGDEQYAYPLAQSASSQMYSGQTATFTHTYTSAGTYTVVVTAHTQYGNSTQATATVTVSNNYYYNYNNYYPTNWYNNYDYDYNDVPKKKKKNIYNYYYQYFYPSYYPSSYDQGTYYDYGTTGYDYGSYDYGNYYYGDQYGQNYYNYGGTTQYDDSGWYPTSSYTY